MGAIYPTSSMFNPQHNWFFEGGCKSTIWTKEENKKFESALAIFDENTPDRWFKVASILPGKSVVDVMKQYEELIEDVSDIEAGLVPTPGYLTSAFTLDLVDDTRFDHLRKRSNASLSRPSDHERKKGVPWTEDEHRRFLLGLQKQGKGDWRNISRNYVITKTPTQVASHAQKYFLRQNSGVKEKRRPSIHDITTANISESSPPLSDFDQKPNLQKSINIVPKMVLDWRNNNGDAPFMVFNGHGRQNLYSGAYQGAYVRSN
ncbi:transcription factor DIVARICATA-like [Silene latifolia]|uniref:transcription factor DIVARICATA-like n=1 Tax=Silene latifolia TaxID=37657 RepID=UPI003D7766C6